MSFRTGIVSLLVMASIVASSQTFAGDRLYQCDDLARRARLSALNIAVYQGDDGWFFRSGDLNHFYMISPDALRFLSRLRDALAFRGTKLVLMPLPPKSILAPEHAVAATTDGDVLFDPAFARSEFEDLVRTFKSNGQVVADVLQTIGTAADMQTGDYYFARDVHWRPKLAQISAAAVQTALVDAAGPSILGDKTFATRKTGEGLNESNTNTTLNQLCAEQIPGESIDFYVTEEADQSLDSFLDDTAAPPPVNVVGTSFTDEANPYNFAGFLREDLRNDVATYSMSGGGVDTALYKWANDGLATTSGAKALVWELPFPERLEEIAPQLEREIIPAVAGLCTGEDQIRSMPYELGPQGSATLALDASTRVSGDGYYIAATLSDPTLRSAAVTFDYRDGRQDVLPIIRPDRVASAPNVFGELTSMVSADLESVTLENRTATSVSGQLSLCRYPAGLLSTSN
ncbi:MAG TPA: hypothetical protein VG757_15945 [Devosia sp.]|nr:hypothetical protein [Devosia sp.]